MATVRFAFELTTLLSLSRSFKSNILIWLSVGKFNFSRTELAKALSSTVVAESFAAVVLSVKVTLTPDASSENILFIIFSDGVTLFVLVFPEFELLLGLLSGVGLFSGLLFPVFSLFPGFTSVELLLALFEELFALLLAVLPLEISLGFVLSPDPLLLELLAGLLSGVGLFSGLLFPVFSLFPGFTSVELLLVLFEELFTLSLAVLLLELSLGFVLSTAPLLLELLSGLLSGAGLSSGLLFPGTVSLSFLCLVYSSNALSMLDFSSKIFSIDFSSSYTFWAFSVASFSLAYASLLIPSLSLSSLTKILAVSKGKRRFALSVANFFAT